MFGATSSPFTSNTNQSSAFGQPQQQQQTSAFGSTGGGTGTTPFGASQGAAGGGGFGGFGSTPSQQQQPAFGASNQGGGAFGSTAAATGGPTTAFGASNFGSSGAFGSSAGNAGGGGGLFGSNAPAAPSGGLFGSTAAAPAPLFNTGATNAFGGAPAAAGGLFSSPSAPFGASTSTFNAAAPATSGIFGAPAATNSTPFGQQQQQQQQRPGTMAHQYQATSRPDGSNNNIVLHAITAMSPYENKSFEELRLEDYMAGNKGQSQLTSTAQPNTAFGAFGAATAPAPAFGSSLFGSNPTPAPAFGAAQPATGAFGAPAPAAPAFGAPAPANAFSFGAAAPKPATTSLFGAPAAAAPTTGLFGAPAPAAFGAAPAPAFGFGATAPAAAAPTTGLFGAPATTAFGAPAAPTQPSTGLFGAAATAAPTPAFGFGAPAAAAPTTGLFGAPAPTTTAFGVPAPAVSTGLFGAPAAAAPATGLFGAPAPAAFGAAPAQSTGLFGAPAATSAFGAPAPAASTGLFGAPAAAAPATGLFGSPAPSAFGAALAQNTGLFGAASSSLFPQTNQVTQQPTAAAGAYYASAMVPNTEAILAQKLAAIEAQKKELALSDNWRGAHAPSSISVTAISMTDPLLSSSSINNGSDNSPSKHQHNFRASTTTSSNIFHPYKYRPSPSLTNIRPRGLNKKNNISTDSKTKTSCISNKSSLQHYPIFSPNTFFASTSKKLTINPDVIDNPTKPSTILKLKSLIDSSSKTPDKKDDNHNNTTSSLTSPLVLQNTSYNGTTSNTTNTNTPHSLSSTTDRESLLLDPTSSKKNLMKDYAYYYDSVTTKTTVANDHKEGDHYNDNDDFHPKLTNAGYITSPSIKILKTMTQDKLSSVPNFSIERPRYGKIQWEDPVDVSYANFDSIVTIKDREAFVYHTEAANGTKPPQGSKLNKPAIITLVNIFPKAGPKATEKEKNKFMKRVEKHTKGMDSTTFISYDSNQGLWKFRVNHFSRYGLFMDDDETDDDDITEEEDSTKYSTIHKVSQQSLSSSNTPTLIQATVFKAPTDEDEDDDESDDTENEEEDEVVNLLPTYAYFPKKIQSKKIKAAEDAYSALMLHMMEEEDMKVEDEVDLFAGGYYTQFKSDFVLDESFEKETSVCAELTHKLDMTSASPSNQDFGFKMSHSFGIAWSSNNNSTIYPLVTCDSTNKAQMKVTKPANLANNQQKEKMISLLETHLEHSNMHMMYYDDKEEEGLRCPFFRIPKSKQYVTVLLKDYITLLKQQFCKTKEDDDDEDAQWTISHAFELLFLLYALDNDNQYLDNNITHSNNNNPNTATITASILTQQQQHQRSQHEAFYSWLHKSLSIDTNQEIQKSLNSNNKDGVYEAIFTAYISGNLTKASSLANQYGYHRISSLLSTKNNNTANYLHTQLKEWKKQKVTSSLPDSLHRLLLILSGDDHLIETDRYKCSDTKKRLHYLNWMKRLNIKASCSNNNDTKDDSVNSIISLVLSYEADIHSSAVPPPLPRYYNHPQRKQEKQKIYELQDSADDDDGSSHIAQNYCLLYRILLSFASNDKKSSLSYVGLGYVISPKGHTPNTHDYSYAFHLVSVMTPLLSATLNDVEEDILLDSFVSQLVDVNLWEWAVYVTLCTNNVKTASRRYLVISRAKELIMRHYTVEDDMLLVTKRQFLENKLRIPSSWFNEALAVRDISTRSVGSSPNELVKHLIACHQHKEALAVIQNEYIPQVLMFGNDAAKSGLKSFLEDCKEQGFDEFIQWNESNGCGATLDFIILQQEVFQFMNDDVARSSEATIGKEYIDNLLIKCETSKRTFIAPTTTMSAPASTITPEIMKSVACAETLSYLHRTLRKLKFLRENKFKNVPIIRDELYKDILTV